jgi:predicted enzyme related to lactoylglutathione lyase
VLQLSLHFSVGRAYAFVVEFAFDCVYYHVADLDHSIQFYQEILGLHFLSRDTVARFEISGVLLELVPTNDTQQLGGSGNARLCLRVADVRATLKLLQRSGVETGSPEVTSKGVVGVFRDLDGNEICLWEASDMGRDKGEIWV